jgi:hypothetical protein
MHKGDGGVTTGTGGGHLNVVIRHNTFDESAMASAGSTMAG